MPAYAFEPRVLDGFVAAPPDGPSEDAADEQRELETVFITADPLTTWLEERLQVLAPGATLKVLRAS